MESFAGDWTKKREWEVLSCRKLRVLFVFYVVSIHHVTQNYRSSSNQVRSLNTKSLSVHKRIDQHD